MMPPTLTVTLHKSDLNLTTLCLAFHYVGPGDEMEVLVLAKQAFHWVNHLPSLSRKVNFTCQFKHTVGFLDPWLNLVLTGFVRIFLRKIDTGVGKLSQAKACPGVEWTSNPLKTPSGQEAEKVRPTVHSLDTFFLPLALLEPTPLTPDPQAPRLYTGLSGLQFLQDRTYDMSVSVTAWDHGL